MDGLAYVPDTLSVNADLLWNENMAKQGRPCERMRGGGVHVWKHFCGNAILILSDLIDTDLKIVNPVQLANRRSMMVAVMLSSDVHCLQLQSQKYDIAAH